MGNHMNNKDILIWLNSISGIGAKTIDKLEMKMGDLKTIWEVSENNIRKIEGVNDKIKERIIKTRNNEYISKLKEKIEVLGFETVTVFDKEYPQILKKIYDPPKILYVKGNILEADKISVGIVGSRKATPYGKWAADKFAKELSQMGVTIVSGMARGVDTTAHKGALNGNGRTIAVLGSGLDVVYPKSNIGLYNEIIENGAVISEFPLEMQPLAQNFPQRNRIISGLCLGVIVIEAKEKSGSLITAQYALEQGREVFALPGNINSIYSKGTNLLLKDGAKILMSIEDILEEISEISELYLKTTKKTINNMKLGEDEIEIVKCVVEYPMHRDNIAIKTKMNISKVNSILTILEMKNVIKRISSNIFAIK